MAPRLTGQSRGPGGRRVAERVRAALVVVLTLALALAAQPGYAVGPTDAPVGAPAQAANDLGTVHADGVTLTDGLGSFGQANAYAFRVADGPGSVQVYVGDLWYDVEVLLLRASALPADSAQWRSLPCGT